MGELVCGIVRMVWRDGGVWKFGDQDFVLTNECDFVLITCIHKRKILYE